MAETLSNNPRYSFLVLVAFLAMTLLVGGIPQAYAQSYSQGMQGSTGQMQVAQGKIKSVDSSGNKLTLEDGTMLTIPPSAQVTKSELREGARVKANYEEKDGENVVTSIQVEPGM